VSGSGGRWAVILGASAGTGAAIARVVARDPGLHVFGVHRGNHPAGAASVEREVIAAGRRVHLRRGDAGTAEAAETGADELLAIAGPRSVKLFVHSLANASVGKLASGGRSQLRPRQFERTFDSMAHSFVYWTQALCARDLLAPSSLLLGLSNPMEDTVARNTALIAATKAALGVYVRHLAQELGPRGHRVNLLKFGAVITPALEATFGRDGVERLRHVLERVIPARRISTVDEVARFVAVLAGDRAAWFNGATIDFTGGETQGLFNELVHPQQEDVDADHRKRTPGDQRPGQLRRSGRHLQHTDPRRAGDAEDGLQPRHDEPGGDRVRVRSVRAGHRVRQVRRRPLL
jgi:NAD(P)-dependent dehydrogenase (short-subunit alcohol dehydrogenase family)